MAQGFTNQLTIPIPVAQGGSGSTTGNLSNMKGTAIGTTTNDNAAAGQIGEFVSSTIPFASGVSITTNMPTNLTSISLTAGDWDVFGNINFVCGGNFITEVDCWISTASATTPDQSLRTLLVNNSGIVGSTLGLIAPFFRLSIASTTTVYITGICIFGSSSTSMNGGIYARRMR